MGGYNVGELFAKLHLDNADFEKMVRETKGSLNDVIAMLQRMAGEQGRLVDRELDRYRAVQEAERIRLRDLRERFRVEQDYANLTGKLRAQELAGVREQARGTNEGFRQEAAYRKARETERARSEQDYANLVKKLRAEEVEAARKANLAIEQDAKRRQQEIIKQIQGEAEARARMEREAEQARRKAEHDRYFQYREMNAAAMSLTTVGLAIGATGAVPLAGMLYSAKQAAEFQDAMAKSLSIMGEVSDGFKNRLAGAAREAAKETGIAAKDIAANLYVIKSAGVEEESQLITLTKTFAKFAVASNSDLTSVTRTVLSTANALQMPYEQIPTLLNKLVAADRVAQGSAAEFAQAISGKAAGAVKLYGRNLDEALAIQMLFMKNGLSAAEAQTGMVRITQSLTRSVQQHGQAVTGIGKTWEQVIYDSKGKMQSWYSILTDLSRMMERMSDKEKAGMFTTLGLNDRARAADYIKMLSGAASSLEEFRKASENAGNAMEEVFVKRMESPKKQLELVKARFTDMAISLGTVVVAALYSVGVALDPVLKGLEGLVGWFTRLDPKLQQFIVIGGLATFGFTTLAGGMLTTAGAAIRLYTDVQFLMGMNGLMGLVGVAGSVASKLGVVAAAILTVVAAAEGMRNILSETHKLEQREVGLRIYDKPDDLRRSGYRESTVQQGIKELAEVRARLKQLREESSKPAVDVEKLKADVTRAAEEAAKATKAAFASVFGDQAGTGVFDPKDVAKDRKSIFSALGMTDYKSMLEEAEKAMATLRAHQKDWGVTDEQMALAEGHLESLKRQWEEAGQAIKAFTASNLYGTSMLKLEADEIQQTHNNLLTSIRALHKAWAAFKNGGEQDLLAENATLNPMLMSSFWKELGESVEKAGVAMNGVMDAVRKSGGDAGEGPVRQAQNMAKAYGLNIPFQEDLDTQAAHAHAVLNKLNDAVAMGWKVSAQTMNAATVAMIEADAKKMHTSAQEYARSIGYDYEQLRRQVDDSVKAGNNAWKEGVRQLGRDIDRVMRTFARGMFDVIWPTGGKEAEDTIKPLVEAFRGAFEKLSAYSDPSKALGDVIDSIKRAGSVAQANAIAVRYFGETAGPQLARELRNGTISVSQINEAMKRATASTLDYEKQTSGSTSAVNKMWRDTLREISAAVMKFAIENGLLQIMKWTGIVGKGVSSLGEAFDSVFKKIGKYIGDAISKFLEWIGVIHKAAKVATDIAVGAAGSAAGSVAGSTAGSVAGSTAGSAAGSAIGGGVGSAAGGAAGAAAGVGTSLTGSLISGGLAMIGGLVGGILNMRQEGSLNAIEHNTRYASIYLGEGDSIHSKLQNISNMMSDFFAGGVGFRGLIDLMMQLTDKIVWGSMPNMQLAAAGGGDVPVVPPSSFTAGNGDKAGDTIAIEKVEVTTNDPEQFVRKLKQLRVVKSR